jgi:hypothetical protein
VQEAGWVSVAIASHGRARLISVHASIVALYQQHLTLVDAAREVAAEHAMAAHRPQLSPSVAAGVLFNPRYCGAIADYLGYKPPCIEPPRNVSRMIALNHSKLLGLR